MSRAQLYGRRAMKWSIYLMTMAAFALCIPPFVHSVRRGDIDACSVALAAMTCAVCVQKLNEQNGKR